MGGEEGLNNAPDRPFGLVMGAHSEAPRWTRGWEAVVDEVGYPVLSELLRSAGGAAARAELERLLGHFWQERAERRRVSTKAHLELSNGESIEVRTVDISASGALVSVPFGHEIDVMTAGEVKLRLTVGKASGQRGVALPARLVRVAGTDDDGVRLGFRFGTNAEGITRLVVSDG